MWFLKKYKGVGGSNLKRDLYVQHEPQNDIVISIINRGGV